MGKVTATSMSKQTYGKPNGQTTKQCCGEIKSCHNSMVIGRMLLGGSLQ